MDTQQYPQMPRGLGLHPKELDHVSAYWFRIEWRKYASRYPV